MKYQKSRIVPCAYCRKDKKVYAKQLAEGSRFFCNKECKAKFLAVQTLKAVPVDDRLGIVAPYILSLLGDIRPTDTLMFEKVERCYALLKEALP